MPEESPIKLEGAKLMPNSCVQELEFSSNQWSRNVVLYLPGDQLSLSPSIMDMRIKPASLNVDDEHDIPRKYSDVARTLERAPVRPMLGNSSAPVTIVLFSDFQCPYCKTLSRTLQEEVVPADKDRVKVVFRFYPLPKHDWAKSAARAAYCASQQGRITGLDYASALAEDLPPSGFIFHISRCGSTLAANGLRAIPGTIVISEPQPISALFHMPKAKEGSNESNPYIGRSEEFIKGIVRAYGQRRSRDQKALVFKLSSWNILQMAIFRKLWPHVPCVVVIRHPLEVAVSCLEQLPGWMRWRQQPRVAESLLGWKAESISEMTDICFCARVLGEFFRSACANLDSPCRIVEYAALTADTVEDIARFFGIATTPATHAQIQASLSVYSKDPSRQRLFTDDRQIKQTKASDLLRQEIKKWAQDAYENLRLTLPARETMARQTCTPA